MFNLFRPKTYAQERWKSYESAKESGIYKSKLANDDKPMILHYPIRTPEEEHMPKKETMETAKEFPYIIYSDKNESYKRKLFSKLKQVI